MTSLNEESIRQALAGDMLVGREVRVLPEVGSTNDYLKEAARGGAPEGLAGWGGAFSPRRGWGCGCPSCCGPPAPRSACPR